MSARYEDGQLPSHEAQVLIGLAEQHNPACVLEIGTYYGHTTRQLAEALPEATIHTLDLPMVLPPQDTWPVEWSDWHLIARRDVGREYRGSDVEARIVQHWGDSMTWNWNLARGATMVFIDGSHTYEYVESDSAKAYDLMGGQGLIVWHDVDPQHKDVVTVVNAWKNIMGRNVIYVLGTRLAYWSYKPQVI